MATDLTLPIVHLNGTGIKTLTEDYSAADDALHSFIDAFGNIEFNARDYYPHGPDSWGKAVDARQEINQKIRDIKDYLDAHRAHLYSSKR
jgi:hypothetical protein